MAGSQAVFEIHVRVEAGDIDQNGHVNNIVYLRWAQEAAAAHWNAVAEPGDRQNLFWIILRHEIDYKQAAYLGDEISVRTWVGAATRFRFERHTEIIRVRDNVALARARTVWCALDAKTRKPAVVSPELRAIFSAGEADRQALHY